MIKAKSCSRLIRLKSREYIRTFKKLFVFCFILFAFPAGLLAQTWEAGVFGGGTGYIGDLNQRTLVKPSGIGAGIFAQRNLNPYLSLKLNYTYGKIQAADSVSGTRQFRDRNLSFHTQLNELSLMAEFNFMKYTPGAMDGEHRFTPYIFFGAGVVKYDPQADYQGQTYDLRSLMTEGQGTPYPSMAIAIPYGAGVKYNFSGSWNIMFSAGYRYARTDYLDDVSGLYADKSKFTNTIATELSDRSGEKTGNYIGVAGTQRGDLRGYDSYLFLGFTLSFTFITSNCYY